MSRNQHNHKHEIGGETVTVPITFNARVWADHCIEVERHHIEDGCDACTPESFIARLIGKVLFQQKLEDIVDAAVGQGSDEECNERRARIIGMLMMSMISRRPCSDPEINAVISRVQELVDDYGIDPMTLLS